MLDKVKEFYRGLKENVPILRSVFGVTLALVGSTTLGYLVPHLTAIFVLMFLQPNQKPLGLKAEVGMVLVLAIIGYLGILLGDYLIDYPLVIMPLLALVIFWSFRFVKVPEEIRLLFLMMAVLMPFVTLNANMLGGIVLSAILFNLCIALVVVRIAFFIFPLTRQEDIFIETKKPLSHDDINLDKLALNSLLVVFPLIFIFFLFNATVGILLLLYIILLGFDPYIYNSKVGPAYIYANLIGGFAGILSYNILVVAPSLVVYIFLTLCVGFYFITNLFSGKKIAQVYRLGFNTFFVVMGTISTTSNEAGGYMWSRLLQVALAITYLIIAFKIANTFNNPKLLND